MPNSRKDKTSSPQRSSSQRRSDDAATSKALEKDADEMADAAEREEKQYDQDHDIFTK